MFPEPCTEFSKCTVTFLKYSVNIEMLLKFCTITSTKLLRISYIVN